MKRLSSRARTVFLVVAALSIAGCSGSGGDSGGSANSAPTISGNPASSVLAGSGYSFRPSASDPNGDALTFIIDNKPSWATFDTKSGQLSGIPTFADSGLYQNILITVSDGELSASTPPFSVEVTQAELGSVTLTWTAPLQNSDGSTLTDLSAIRIYFGNTEGYYPNQLLIDNPSITTYVVDNLALRTYYFVATALNSEGAESLASNVEQISVNQ